MFDAEPDATLERCFREHEMSVIASKLSLTGDAITDFARSLLISGRWGEALDGLKETVPGLSGNQAISVLKGEKRFISSDGDDGGDVILVDDPDGAEWAEEVADVYGGICSHKGLFYRPYGVVLNYGPDDLGFAGKDVVAAYVSSTLFEMMDKHPDAQFDQRLGSFEKRAMHYANDDTDVAIKCYVNSGDVRRPHYVLFERVPEQPFWLDRKTPQAAVEESFYLDRLGYQTTYGTHDPSTEKDFIRIRNRARQNFNDVRLRGQSAVAEDKLKELLLAGRSQTQKHYDDRRVRILQQNDACGYGYRTVDFGGRIGEVKVPNGPLKRWALSRGSLMKDAGPEWTPVSMSGLKQAGDDPVHTDWITGAGLENEDFLKGPLKDIQERLAAEIQSEELGFRIHVLVAGKPLVSGRVSFCSADSVVDQTTIAIIPNAGIKYDRIAREAGAVIAIAGGAMSHLAVNGLDYGQVIIRDPDARKNYAEGDWLEINVGDGLIRKLNHIQDEPSIEEPGGFRP